MTCVHIGVEMVVDVYFTNESQCALYTSFTAKPFLPQKQLIGILNHLFLPTKQ